MITKRDFIAGGASLVAAAGSLLGRRSGAQAVVRAGTPAPAPGRTGWATQVHDVDLVVFNERYADARAFAQVHAAHGIDTLPMQGDAGVLWYTALRQRIAGGERRIAGVGTHTDFFILHTLARETGLKVGHEHRLPAAQDHDGLLVSWTLTERSRTDQDRGPTGGYDERGAY